MMSKQLRRYCKDERWPSLEELQTTLSNVPKQERLSIIQGPPTTFYSYITSFITGVDVDTPLMQLVKQSRPELIAALLESVDHEDRLQLLTGDKQTLLHVAATSKNLDIIDSLLDCLDLNQQIQLNAARNKSNQTAIQFAEVNGNKAAALKIRKHLSNASLPGELVTSCSLVYLLLQ